MWRSFLSNLPSAKFWLANLVFWLFLNTLATDNSYRTKIEYGREADWLEMWVNYLPWWVMWALVAPIVVAFTKQISSIDRKPKAFILQNLLLTLVSLAIYWALSVIGALAIELQDFSWRSLKEVMHYWQFSLLHIDFLVYLAVLCTGYTLAYYQRAKDQAISNEQLVAQLYEIELESLKSQLNPHFLFNTLNSVTSLIRLDKRQEAIKALSELSLMLRTVLENQSNQFIALTDELDFINSYLTIQKLRFGEKLVTDVTVDPNALSVEIPFMLLQPLVENAVQHGSQLESNQNKLTLKIDIQGIKLHVKLINKVPENDQHEGFGIGVKNCKSRLSKLYDDFEFSLAHLDDGYFETVLVLPTGEEDD